MLRFVEQSHVGDRGEMSERAEGKVLEWRPMRLVTEGGVRETVPAVIGQTTFGW
jgi:hypothetical protein